MQDEPKLSFDDIIGGAELDELRSLGKDEVDDNAFGGTDAYGNELLMFIYESECETHGTESSLVLTVNNQGAIYHISEAPKIVGWLNEQIAEARRQGRLD